MKNTFIYAGVRINKMSTYSSKDYYGYHKVGMGETVDSIINQLNNCPIGEKETFKLEDEKIENEFGTIHFLDNPVEEVLKLNFFKELFPLKYNDNKEIIAICKEEERLSYAKRKAEGFISCKVFHEMTYEDYIGGFSIEVTDHEKDYLSQIGVFGYYGHYFRKAWHDEVIEKEFREIGKDLEFLSSWLSSSDARHWSDSAEHLDDAEEHYYQFVVRVKEKVKDMYNYGFIYFLKDHKGSLRSTQELKEKYKDQLL